MTTLGGSPSIISFVRSIGDNTFQLTGDKGSSTPQARQQNIIAVVARVVVNEFARTDQCIKV